jgi:hypothetical protein
VTFRAAGTSLSGQAISDSVLIVLGDNWNGREIRGQGTANPPATRRDRRGPMPGWRRSGARSARSGLDQRLQNRRHRRQQRQRHVLRHGAKHLSHWPGFVWCWPTAVASIPKTPPASRRFAKAMPPAGRLATLGRETRANAELAARFATNTV